MPAADAMTIDERRKYLQKLQPHYWRADRAEKGRLLTEMERVTGLHRKSVVRLLGQPSLERNQPPRRPRRRTYGTEVDHAVAVVWESLDYVCAERLTPVLLSTAQHLAQHRELALTPALEAQLAQISRSTCQYGRLLYQRKGSARSATRSD